MKRLLKSIIIAGCMTVASCDAPTPGEINSSLDAADSYLADGNPTEARRTADAILGSDSTRMSASQLGRLALVYMQVADKSDDPSTVGQAIVCYRMAVRVNTDSAEAYFSHLSGEETAYAEMLREISHRMEAPRDIPADEPLDDEGHADMTTDTHQEAL